MHPLFQHPLASFLTAVRFLTVFPISTGSERDGEFFQTSLFWFPLIGILMGGLIAGTLQLLASFLPVPVLSVIAIVMSAGITGCLHLDGLADSGDGLLSARPKERALEIMRDSRTGAMGVIGLIVVLLGKYAALSSCSSQTLVLIVFLIPLAGRTAILLSMTILPYARGEGGLGSLFYSKDSKAAATLALLLCLLIGFLFSSAVTLTLVSSVCISVAAFSYWCFRKLGGATGDTLGAVCEITECVAALSLSALYFAG